MIVRFWGVRGSIPVPGPSTLKYGGNTPCVEVRSDEGHLLVIDAGTGIRPLGQELVKNEFGKGQGEGFIFFSHWLGFHHRGAAQISPMGMRQMRRVFRRW